MTACLHRLQQLNFYVRCKAAPENPIPLTEAELAAEPWNLQSYDVVILIEASYETCVAVNSFCRKFNKKFMCADAVGVFGRVFNDFGDSFDVLDKNGEELPECVIQSIETAENALVTLLPNALHNLENGNEVLLTGVDGMQLIEGQTHSGENKDVKSDSINDTIWKVTVEKANSFRIGDTRMYHPFKSQGVSRPLRPKLTLKFKSFADTMINLEPPHDCNMFISDFEKLDHNDKAHLAFKTLDKFKSTYKQLPRPWNAEDALKFINIASSFKPELLTAKFDDSKSELKFLY